MNFLHIILPIVVGGIIGYFTNYIAIKMMFRPRKAIYVGGHKLPFTPGIIPKNQSRVANAVGDAINDQLLTTDAVLGNLKDTCNKLITDLSSEFFVSDTTLNELTEGRLSDGDFIAQVSRAISHGIIEKIESADLSSAIRDFGEKTIDPMLEGKPMISMLFGSTTKNAIYDKAESMIRDYLAEHGEDKLQGFITDYIKDLSKKPLKDIVENEDNQYKLTYILIGTIDSAIDKHGASFLSHVDIRGIAVDRINAMSPEEVEELTLSVMKQELQAVINLGALIGAIIGAINIFI